MNIFILNTLIIILKNGILFSLLATLSERVLIMNGIARGNTIGLIIAAFILAVFKTFDYSNSIYGYICFIMIVGPIGANRLDITTTIQKGRWWWKSNNNI